jgi:hypothetical protein
MEQRLGLRLAAFLPGLPASLEVARVMLAK